MMNKSMNNNNGVSLQQFVDEQKIFPQYAKVTMGYLDKDNAENDFANGDFIKVQKIQY